MNNKKTIEDRLDRIEKTLEELVMKPPMGIPYPYPVYPVQPCPSPYLPYYQPPQWQWNLGSLNNIQLC